MFKKKVELSKAEETQATLLEAIRETTETVNYDPSDEKQVEALAVMSKSYADIVKAEAELMKVEAEKKDAKKKNIITIATTATSVVSTVALTIVTFAYETSGNGNFFTTTGRQTIGNVLKSTFKK